MKKYLTVLAFAGLALMLGACGERNADKLLAIASDADRAGDINSAINAARRAVKYNPDSINALLALAALQEKNRQYADAAATAEAAVKLDAENFTAQYLLGRALYRQNERRPESAAPLRRASNLQKKNSDVTLFLASLYAELGDLKQLGICLQKLGQDAKVRKTALYCNLAGIYYYEYRMYDAAFKNFFAAYSLDRTSPEIVYNLARCMEMKGNRSGAEQMYRQYLKLTGGKPEYGKCAFMVQEKLSGYSGK